MNKNIGFTFIELLVVIVIIGVLMAYAIPSYQRQVIRSKRVEAQNMLMELAAIQEKHNAVFNQYADTVLGPAETLTNLGLSGRFDQTADYVYTMDNPNGYTFQADAQGNTQINDNFGIDCTTLNVDALGTRSPLGCWQ